MVENNDIQDEEEKKGLEAEEQKNHEGARLEESSKQKRGEDLRLEEEAKEAERESLLICSGGELPGSTSPVVPAERELSSIEKKNHFM